MAFVSDPTRIDRAFDPTNGQELLHFVRDVPKGERWYYFSIKGREFLVRGKFSISEEEKIFRYECDVDQLEKSFRQTILVRKPIYRLTSEEFRDTVLPALREALICLIGAGISPHGKKVGWKPEIAFSSLNLCAR
jgi:hypothetical protein